ncbi:MAG: toll/interleukin-1 receptor domain-containing protein [Pseudomonadota bacterium]
MADVFISYARVERPKAERIRDLLQEIGLTVFLDVEGLDGGDVFPDVLDREVKTAGAVLGLWSPHALSRPWIKTECLIGKDRGVLVPAAVEPINPLTDVPAAFYGVQHIDLMDFDGDPNDPAWVSLVKSLARTLKRPELLAREAESHRHSKGADEDLRAEVESMRAELNALRAREAAPTAPAPEIRKPRRKVERDQGVGPGVMGLALVATLLSAFSGVGEGFGFDFRLLAPLAALIVAARNPSRSVRWAFAALVIFPALIQVFITDDVKMGGLGGLGWLAALLCFLPASDRGFFRFRPAMVAMSAVLLLLAGMASLEVFITDNAGFMIIGATLAVLAVALLTAFGFHSFWATAAAIVVLLAIVGLDPLERALGLDAGESVFGLRLRSASITISSLLSCLIAAACVFLLTRGDAVARRNVAGAAAGAAIAVALFSGPIGYSLFDIVRYDVFGALSVGAAYAQEARPQTGGVDPIERITVVGRRVAALPFADIAAIAGGLLAGVVFKARLGLALAAIFGAAVMSQLVAFGIDERADLTLPVALAFAVWVGGKIVVNAPVFAAGQRG